MASQPLDRLASDAAVKRHEIDALARLPLDDIEEQIRAQLHDRSFGADLVNRHRSDHHRASRDQLDANFVEVGAGGKIHHRVGAESHRRIKLLDFFFQKLMEVRSADIRIDLGPQPFADADSAELMMDIARDDDLTSGDPLADQLGREALVLGDLDHFLSDGSLTSGLDLSHGKYLPELV